jgi:predicted metalloprotease
MRWMPGGPSSNLEDRRGEPGGGGGGGGLRLGLGGMVVLLVLSVVFRQDFFSLLSGAGGAGGPGAPSAPVTVTASAEEQQLVQFVSFVLDDVQSTWTKLLPSMGTSYRDAKLVLFRDATETSCGVGATATGPFYCSGDEKVYIDLGFYDELRRRFGAPGDFAQAYVLAHEIGHHVQKLLGTDAEVRRIQRARPGLANDYSVRLELQADCYAGVWAYSTAQRDILEKGDVEEGLTAAAAVGDDRIQRMATGRVNPDAFTHGTSAQRAEWFNRGYTTGRPDVCDTFSASARR